MKNVIFLMKPAAERVEFIFIQRCPMQAINYDNKTQHRKRYINPNVQLGK